MRVRGEAGIFFRGMFFFVVTFIIIACTIGCISPSVRYARPELQKGGEDRKNLTSASKERETQKKSGVDADKLERIIRSYMGTPYRYGGVNRKGIDCSGLVCAVFREYDNIKLPHSSRAQYRMGKPVLRHRIQMGDLVFFRGGIFNRINHVGIYSGQNRFIHASSTGGVIFSSFDDKYYRKNLVGIRRIL